jgi:nitrous oxidase accessory protein NosD
LGGGALVVYLLLPTPADPATTAKVIDTRPTPNTSPIVPPTSKPAPPTTKPAPPTTKPKPPPRDLVVGPTGRFRTIADALVQARTGAVIKIQPGTYKEALTLDKDATLVGDGPPGSVIVIAREGASALTAQAAGRRVHNLTLRSQEGAANKDFPTVKIIGGNLRLDDCDIGWEVADGKKLRDAGACVEVSGTDAKPQLSGCKLHHGWKGLAVVGEANPKLTDCKIEDNQIGVLVDRAAGELEKCSMVRNLAVGVQLTGQGAHLNLRSCEVLGGMEDGVVFDDQARGTLEDCTVAGHRAGDSHAVKVWNSAEATLTNCKIFKNQRGVKVTEGGSAVLSACKIHGNTGLALEITGSDGKLDAGRCKSSDLFNNGRSPRGTAWDYTDRKTFTKPSE